MNDSEGTVARLRGVVHHVDLTVRDMAASAPFYEALLGFLGYARVKQEAGLHAWDLVRDGHGMGRVALRAARSGGRATILDAPAAYPQYGADYHAVSVADPDGLELEVVHFVT